MPSRVIRHEVNESVSLARVSELAELLYRKLLSAADDFGRYTADPELLAAYLYQRRRSVTAAEVAARLDELVNADGPGRGPVLVYEVEGKRFLWLPSWERLRGKSNRGNRSKDPLPLSFPEWCTERPGDWLTSAEVSDPRESPRNSADANGAPPEESRSRGVEVTDSQEARPRRKRPAAAAALEDLPALRFAQDFRTALLRVHEGFKPPTEAAFAKWVKAARLLIGERTEPEVRRLAQWLFDTTSPSEAATFWRGVVLSVPKFREKFDQIAARRRGEGERHGPRSAGNATSDLAERARQVVRARAAGADGAR